MGEETRGRFVRRNGPVQRVRQLEQLCAEARPFVVIGGGPPRLIDALAIASTGHGALPLPDPSGRRSRKELSRRDDGMTHAMIAVRVGYHGKAKSEAARKWCVRNAVPREWRGNRAGTRGTWIYKREHVEQAIAGQQFTGLV